jgi:hypothetical protein
MCTWKWLCRRGEWNQDGRTKLASMGGRGNRPPPQRQQASRAATPAAAQASTFWQDLRAEPWGSTALSFRNRGTESLSEPGINWVGA